MIEPWTMKPGNGEWRKQMAEVLHSSFHGARNKLVKSLHVYFTRRETQQFDLLMKPYELRPVNSTFWYTGKYDIIQQIHSTGKYVGDELTFIINFIYIGA